MKIRQALLGNWKPAVIVVLVAATFAYAGLSNFDQIKCTSPYMIGADSIMSSVTFTLDSLGRPFTCYAIWTPPVAVTVLDWNVYSVDTVGAAGDTSTVFLRSGTALTAQTLYVRYGKNFASSTTRFNIPKAAPCSLFVSDTIVTSLSTVAAEHGSPAKVVLDYTPRT